MMSESYYTLLTDKMDEQSWRDWCLSRLAFHEQTAQQDPLTNSVRRLAYEVFEGVRQGDISLETVSALVQGANSNALRARADEFILAHAQADIASGVSDVIASSHGLSFDDFQGLFERPCAGIVFTAHPTFAMSRKLREEIGRYTSQTDDDASSDAGAFELLSHRPDLDITLRDEHAETQQALAHAKASLNTLARSILTTAKEHFPDRWHTLAPMPLTVASWVGYDLDGRTDIHWSEALRLRLSEKAAQLEDYAQQLTAICLPELDAQKAIIAKALQGSAKFTGDQAEKFTTELVDPADVAGAANTLSANDPRRLTSLSTIIEQLDGLIEQAADDGARLELCILRASMKNYGLGSAHIHLRVNASQVRSALRADLGVEQADGFSDRTTFATAAARAKEVAQHNVNIASVFLERMTARRQLMLCAQFLKHIDADTPIRFLIAECEAPATIMGAVFLARYYGVDHRLDISPLFETPEAMESGGRFMERLLDEEEYVAYIRKRGRVSIQIGFSDSGRFMGQIAANLAIERLQILLARALKERGIVDVEVLIFNTHGESMGRGTFPGTLKERFDYLITPWARSRYRRDELRLLTESSFQGGDGFLHFQTQKMADATVAAMFNWRFQPSWPDKTDCFYQELDYSWDLYRSLKSWQEHLFEDPAYQAVIAAFSSSLLLSTGSRKVRRQSGAFKSGPRSLRAIPHNAILQQLAIPANVVGGVGTASGREVERLLDHIRGSKRMQQIVQMLHQSRRVTSVPALRAYAVLHNPSFWISKASSEGDPSAAAICEKIASHLSGTDTAVMIEQLANHLAADLAKLDRIYIEIDGPDDRDQRRESRRSLHTLHAIRQALIMYVVYLVAGLPGFSGRHEISRSALIDMALDLRLSELIAHLEEIFPASETNQALFESIEEQSDDALQQDRGYPEIHRNVIQPLGKIETLLQEITAGIAHHYRAYG